jgi:pimeloyl-ACP methyl ester carboxylesterase
LRETVADTVALLDAAGVDHAHIVGHDWGGAVVWSAIARHPHRFRSAVVVSTPHPAAMRYAATHSDQILRSWYMGLFQLPVVAELIVAPGLERLLRGTGLPADKAAHYARRMREPGALTGALGWYRALGAAAVAEAFPRTLDPRAARGAAARSSERPEWRGPTTYLWGRYDVALGRTAAEHTRRFVQGEYQFVEIDGGHWLPETRPDDVADAVLLTAGQTR